MSDYWDIDSHRSEFENEDHWQLRKSFMLAHKDKFPEDELVCLAQVFTNIEFLGCRYPDKTMIRVAELAKGVVEGYREQRKNSLKRTFVAASDAASAKVKGQVCKGEEPVLSKKNKKMGETEENLGTEKTEETTPEKGTKSDNSNARASKYGGVKTFNIKENDQTEKLFINKEQEETPNTPADAEEDTSSSGIKSGGPLGDFVLVLRGTDEHPVSIIERNSLLNKCTISWDFEKDTKGVFVCKLFLNNQCFATSMGSTMKMSKEHTAMVAIAKLRESYYGIRVKHKFYSDTTVSPTQLGSTANPPPSQLGEDNVGRKLMKLMGWQGGGLGTKGQGREDPVAAALQVRRGGLGLDQNSGNLVQFKERVKEYVKTWLRSNSDQDLVFCSDFTTEERKVLHEIALNLSLKSKSYGKDANRQLVISRKWDPREILKELLTIGGNSDRYELLYPTNT